MHLLLGFGKRDQTRKSYLPPLSLGQCVIFPSREIKVKGPFEGPSGERGIFGVLFFLSQTRFDPWAPSDPNFPTRTTNAPVFRQNLGGTMGSSVGGAVEKFTTETDID